MSKIVKIDIKHFLLLYFLSFSYLILSYLSRKGNVISHMLQDIIEM